MGFRFHPGIGNKKDPVNPVNPVKKEKDFESCIMCCKVMVSQYAA